jgi:hypothetical protein
VVFVADDLGAWLVGLLADAGRKKLTTLVLGSDQERALRRASAAAVQLTAEQLAPPGNKQADQLAMVVGEVFRDAAPDVAVTQQATLLEALQTGIVGKLAVLDDPAFTGTGRSSAELLGVSGGVLAETLACHLVREIMVRGSSGGPLAPLADQLNHDMTHLQGQRLEGMLAQLVGQVMALARAGSAMVMTVKPVRLLPRPAFLVGRDALLADLDVRLSVVDDAGPRVVALHGLGGAGKTSVAAEYAHRHLGEVELAWQFPPRTQRCCCRSSPGWRLSSVSGRWPMPAIRWRRCMRCWPRSRQAGCWCSTTPLAWRWWSRFCRQPDGDVC